MFAAFAEHYQIWAEGAHPLVGLTARKRGGVRKGCRGGGEERRKRGMEEASWR